MKKFPWGRTGQPNKPSKDMGKKVLGDNIAVKDKSRSKDTPKPMKFKGTKGC